MLEQAEVDVLVTRTVQDIPSGIAERTEGRNGKRSGIEPSIGRRAIEFCVAVKIRTIVGAETERRSARIAVIKVREKSHGEGAARAEA